MFQIQRYQRDVLEWKHLSAIRTAFANQELGDVEFSDDPIKDSLVHIYP